MLFIDSLVAANLYVAAFLLVLGSSVTARLNLSFVLRLIPWCFGGLVISISLSHASWFIWPEYLVGLEIVSGCALMPLIYWATCERLNHKPHALTPLILAVSLIASSVDSAGMP